MEKGNYLGELEIYCGHGSTQQEEYAMRRYLFKFVHFIVSCILLYLVSIIIIVYYYYLYSFDIGHLIYFLSISRCKVIITEVVFNYPAAASRRSGI